MERNNDALGYRAVLPSWIVAALAREGAGAFTHLSLKLYREYSQGAGNIRKHPGTLADWLQARAVQRGAEIMPREAYEAVATDIRHEAAVELLAAANSLHHWPQGVREQAAHVMWDPDQGHYLILDTGGRTAVIADPQQVIAALAMMWEADEEYMTKLARKRRSGVTGDLSSDEGTG